MIVNRKLLLSALRIAQKSTDRKTKAQALTDLVLCAAGETLTVRGCDGHVHTAIVLHGEATEEFTGSTDPAPLVKFLAASKAESARLAIGDHQLLVACNGATATFELGKLSNMIEWPTWLGDSTVTVIESTTKWLHGTLTFLESAICRDETRFHLNHLNLDDRNLVATDGHRLHLVEHNPGGEVAVEHLLQAAAVATLKLACHAAKGGSVQLDRVGRIGHRARVSGAGLEIELLAKKPDCGTFPPYEQVIPNDVDACWFTVGVGDLLEAAKGAKTALGSSVYNTALQLHPMDLTVRAAVPGQYEAACALVSREGDEPIGVNASFLMDALGAFGKKDVVRVSYRGRLDPVRIDCEDEPSKLAVVMPIRF